MNRPTTGIELCKWLGVVCMLYDHADLYVLQLPMASHVGALAFPLFAVALAAAMHANGTIKHSIVFRRLIFLCLFIQLLVLLVRGPLPFNVIGTLATGVLLSSALLHESLRTRVLLSSSALVLSCFCEFPLVGPLVVLAASSAFRTTRTWPVYLAAFPLHVWNQGSFVSLVGVALALHLVAHGPSLPRIRHVFYPIYALQWVVFRFL